METDIKLTEKTKEIIESYLKKQAEKAKKAPKKVKEKPKGIPKEHLKELEKLCTSHIDDCLKTLEMFKKETQDTETTCARLIGKMHFIHFTRIKKRIDYLKRDLGRLRKVVEIN
jgi:hypothetical protein